MGREGMVVFRMNIGRNANADPRWMIPVICRRGGITKNEIGAIRILDNETQFEIAGHAAERFSAEVRKPDTKDPNIRFATLNENVTPAPESEMLVAAPARQYDKPRPFHKKHSDRDGKPAFKGKSDFKGEVGLQRQRATSRSKSGVQAESRIQAVKAEPCRKPEARGKLFLKNAPPGDRPLIKKRRDRPGKN